METYRLRLISRYMRQSWANHIGFSKNQVAYKSSNCQEYIVNRVKGHDYESYLAMLLSPKTWRYPAFILHAFNVELSLALESVKDPRAATGRFAFWSDCLDRLFANQTPHDHPVTRELTQLYNSGMLGSVQCRKWLTNLVTARQQIAVTPHIDSVQTLEMYADKTKSSLYYLLLNLSGCTSLNADHAASHLGKTHGLVNALRSTAYLASVGQIQLPQELLTKHGVSQQDVLRRNARVKEVAFELACVGHSHLEKTKSLLKDVPSESKIVFLPLTVCENVLETLRRTDFNVFDSRLQTRNSMLPWQLWRTRRSFLKVNS